MPSRKRPAEAAPDGAAAAAKKAGIVQLLEVIATHQMDPGLIEAVENDLTPALLEELRTEHPAAEWSYRSMWLRGLSRRAMNGLPRSGSPMMIRTWRTPSVPAVAAIGGGRGFAGCSPDFSLAIAPVVRVGRRRSEQRDGTPPPVS